MPTDLSSQSLRQFPPFGTWPIHSTREGLAAVWFVRPMLLVTHALCETATAEAVHYINDHIDALIEMPGRTVPLTIVHDFRRVKRYEVGCREAWSARIKVRKDGYLNAAYIVAPDNLLIQMAASALELATRISGHLHLGEGSKEEGRGRFVLCRRVEDALQKAGFERSGLESSWPRSASLTRART